MSRRRTAGRGRQTEASAHAMIAYHCERRRRRRRRRQYFSSRSKLLQPPELQCTNTKAALMKITRIKVKKILSRDNSTASAEQPHRASVCVHKRHALVSKQSCVNYMRRSRRRRRSGGGGGGGSTFIGGLVSNLSVRACVRLRDSSGPNRRGSRLI